ncbi:MAG: hypothetical protein AB8B55_24275 [Mariniblastus sp.]
MFPSRQFRAQTLAATLLLTLLMNCTMATIMNAQEDPIIPPQGGQAVLAFGEQSPIDFQKQNIEATAAWVAIKDMPFEKAYQVDSEVRYSDAKNMQVNIPIKTAFKKGDTILLSFWIRRPGAGGQPNNVYLDVFADSEKPTYQYKLAGYRAWKQHVRSFVATTDSNPENSIVNIQLGEAGKVCEIADLQLINYGADYDITTLPRSTVNYKGREPDAQWRKDALARIEKIRKGNLTVEVVD